MGGLPNFEIDLQYTTKTKMHGIKIKVINHALILILNSLDAFLIIPTLQFCKYSCHLQLFKQPYCI